MSHVRKSHGHATFGSVSLLARSRTPFQPCDSGQETADRRFSQVSNAFNRHNPNSCCLQLPLFHAGGRGPPSFTHVIAKRRQTTNRNCRAAGGRQHGEWHIPLDLHSGPTLRRNVRRLPGLPNADNAARPADEATRAYKNGQDVHRIL